VAAMGGPCVVKPAVGSAAGAGITTGVRPGRLLAAAVARAGAYSRSVMVERQVEGDNYRLLFLDGDLIDAVLRRPPSVVGDGRASLRRLIQRENARRAASGTQAAQSLIGVDRDVVSTLRAQGAHLGTVLPAGQRILIKKVVNDNCREDNEAATDRLSPAIVGCAAAAASAVGARFAGVDVITRDPGVPLARSGGVVLEVNTTPGLYYHYRRRDDGVPVATIVLERLLDRALSGRHGPPGEGG